MTKKIPAPPMHPPGKEPKITDEERKSLAKNRPISVTSSKKLREDELRLTEKKVWVAESKASDQWKKDRQASISATDQILRPKIDDLIEWGAKLSTSQSEKASKDRDPLNHLIDLELSKEPLANSREIWDAISAFDGDIHNFWSVKIIEAQGVLAVKWKTDEDEECSQKFSRHDFKTRVSLRRTKFKG